MRKPAVIFGYKNNGLPKEATVDYSILIKAVVSATILLGILLWFKNIYYSCVVTAAGWHALKKISKEVGFKPRSRIDLYKIFTWIFFWPITLPAHIHGKGKAAAKIEGNYIVIAYSGCLCSDLEFCMDVAGETMAETMSENSDEYDFEVTRFEYDEDEDAIFCSIRRKEKEVEDA